MKTLKVKDNSHIPDKYNVYKSVNKSSNIKRSEKLHFDSTTCKKEHNYMMKKVINRTYVVISYKKFKKINIFIYAV